jgi:hypothetical protein
MVSSISFVQANLQHNIAQPKVLSRTAAVNGIYMAVVQEPWVRQGHIVGLNIPWYTLFCGSGTDRPRTCILAKNGNIWMLPGFPFRDLVRVQIKYDEGEEKRSVVVCSVYLPFHSEHLPQQGSLRNSCDIVKRDPSHSLWAATPIVIIQFEEAQTAMIQEWPWWNF